MGVYLSQLAFGLFASTPAHAPEVDVHSQSEIQCCTTVLLEESDDEVALHPKNGAPINDE